MKLNGRRTKKRANICQALSYVPVPDKKMSHFLGTLFSIGNLQWIRNDVNATNTNEIYNRG